MKLHATRTRLVVGAATAALAATAFLAGCSDSGSDDDATPTGTSAEVTSGADEEASGTVEVIDQTHLLLATAQDTLEARGLTVETVDSTGQGRTVDDPTLWVVVAQDPLSGEVEAGTVVTLDVRRTDDPAS